MPIRRLWPALLVAGAALVSGCGASSTGAASPAPASLAATRRPLVPPTVEITVAVVVPSVADEYWQTLAAGVAAADAADPMVQTTFGGGASAAATAGQVQAVQSAIARRADVLAIVPGQWRALEPAVAQAQAAGLPVLLLDADVPDPGVRSAFVGTDNALGGQLAGEYIVRRVGRGGVVAILRGVAGDVGQDARVAGARAAFSAAGLRLMAVASGDGDRAAAAREASRLLAERPELAAIFATDDEMALGALDAARAAGRPLVVVGYDGSAAGLASIAAGELAASVAQEPARIGREGVVNAARLARGLDVAPITYAGVELVTAENLARYRAALENTP